MNKKNKKIIVIISIVLLSIILLLSMYELLAIEKTIIYQLIPAFIFGLSFFYILFIVLVLLEKDENIDNETSQ